MASTAVAVWGNSEALRIPKNVLRAVGLRKGDMVSFSVTPNRTIEIVPVESAHRHVDPARGVTFENLFADWDGTVSPSPWPDDDLEGAEWEAWA